MAAPFVKYWRGWNAPIAARRLSEHKTVVGFAFGVCAAVVVTFVQFEDWLDRRADRL